MSLLSFIPLSLSIIFSLVGVIPAHSIEQKEERLSFEYSVSSKKPLKTIIEKEQDQIHNHLQSPSSLVLDDFQPSLPKVDSSLKLQPYCDKFLIKRSNLRYLRELNENEQEAIFNKTPNNSPSSPPSFLSSVQDFQTISLIASVNVNQLSKLKKDYDAPFSLSISNSALPFLVYAHRFHDIGKEFGKSIVLEQYFPLNWERLPIYFAFTLHGYRKTKKQDTIFDLEIDDKNDNGSLLIDKGKVGKGLYKRDLLKYSLPAEHRHNSSIALYFDIYLFDREKTNMSIKIAKKVKDHSWF